MVPSLHAPNGWPWAVVASALSCRPCLGSSGYPMLQGPFSEKNHFAAGKSKPKTIIRNNTRKKPLENLVFPQIAGSYRGSYFSKIGLLIPTMVAMPLHDLHSVLLLAASATASPSFVSLHDLHSGLLLAAVAALSPFIFLPVWSPFWAAALHDLHSGLLLAAPATLPPFICPPAWSPFWPALRCPCHPASLHLSPCMISILGCSWLSFVSLHDLDSGLLLAAAAALSPFICLPAWSPFWAALGCGCRLVSLHLFPCMISILGCSWLPLPPCLPSFVSCMISILACSWLPLPPCLPSFVPLHDLHSGLLSAAPATLPPFICLPAWSPFWAALGFHLSPCMISILGCSWLPLPPCLPSFVSLRDLHSGLLLAAVAALSPFICFPAWSPFWAALGCRCRLVSLHLSCHPS